MKGPDLVGDVGGTNARFAVSEAPGHLRDVRVYRTAEYASFYDALAAYLSDIGGDQAVACSAARVAAAGPIDESGCIALTNSPWELSEAGLCSAIGGGPARLFNDLEAVALALPHLTHEDYRTIGGQIAEPLSGSLLAVNVGTGFGAAPVFALGEGTWVATASEAGHMTYAARTAAQADIVSEFQSVEDILSGSGLGHLYSVLQRKKAGDGEVRELRSSEVFQNARGDPVARATIEIFGDLLARISGDLVLAHGAWGGVFYCGSVAAAWAQQTDQDRFRDVFEAKGKMSGRMRRVATQLILAPQPALLGLSHAGHLTRLKGS